DEEHRRGLAAVEAARQDEVRDVVAADRVAGDEELVGDGPAGDGLAVRVRARVRLCRAGLVGRAAGDAADEPAAGAAVPAETVDLDAVVRGRRRRDVELDVLPRQDARLRRI